VSLYRITENDNPSNRFEQEFEAVSVVEGRWIFVRDDGPVVEQTFARRATSDYTVEIERHGGVWEKIEPEPALP
jgi:hypothetical protein